MAFHVRDKETDTLVRELARQRGVGLTEAVKLAVTGELDRKENEVATPRRNGGDQRRSGELARERIEGRQSFLRRHFR